MGHYILKALSGPLKGKSFPVKKTLQIGRATGDILLKDQLVSDLHAEIKTSPDGKMMILDRDSKNKILINNKRVAKSVLKQGTRFKIGLSEFECVYVNSPEEVLVAFLKKQGENIKDQPLSLKPFVKKVKLCFLSGLQKGTQYELSYGPRFFGSQSVDGPLLDQKAPEKAFALLPKKQDIVFTTNTPSVVRLKGEKIKQSPIKNGDKIFIGDSTLEIRLT